MYYHNSHRYCFAHDSPSSVIVSKQVSGSVNAVTEQSYSDLIGVRSFDKEFVSLSDELLSTRGFTCSILSARLGVTHSPPSSSPPIVQ